MQDDIRILSDLPRGARLLGFDLGTKTIGLAMSDVERLVATPLTTLPRGKFTADSQAIGALVSRYGIGGFVFGLPVNMDGSEGPRAQATRAFARNLRRVVPIPAAFWDERLSTAAVLRAMIDADMSRRKRDKGVDQAAAAYILQGALDRMRTRVDDTSGPFSEAGG